MAFKLADGYINLTAKDRALHGAFNKLESRAGRLGGVFGGVGAQLGMLFGGVAVTAGVATSIKAFTEFEQQMANVSTMLDSLSMKHMPEFTKAAGMMSVQFGQGTQSISDGMYQLLSAGVAPSKMLETLEVTAKAAAAGMTDMGTAATGITNVLDAYGMSVDKAGYVSDVLFKMVQKGKTTFPALANNLGKVAAMAATAGMSLEEMGAAVVTFTKGGLNTEMSVTGLRALLNTLVKGGGPEAAKVAKELGIEFGISALRAQGLTGILGKLKGASIEQLSALMPNVRALNAFAVALNQGDTMGENYAAMLEATGATQEAFEKQTDTLSFKFKQFGQRMKMAGVTAGGVMAPAVGAALDWMTKAFEALGDAVQIVFKNWDSIVKWATLNSAYYVVKWYEDVKYFITNIPTYLAWLGDNWQNIFKTMWSFTKSIVGNMGTNLAEFFKSVWGWMKGEGWDFTWTGLLEGFENTIDALPQIAERGMTNLEKALKEGADEAGEALAAGIVKHFDDKEAKLKVKGILEGEEGPLGPTKLAGAAAGGGLGGGGGGKSSGFVGLEEMWKTLAGASLEEQMLTTEKEIVKTNRELIVEYKAARREAHEQHLEAQATRRATVRGGATLAPG